MFVIIESLLSFHFIHSVPFSSALIRHTFPGFLLILRVCQSFREKIQLPSLVPQFY